MEQLFKNSIFLRINLYLFLEINENTVKMDVLCSGGFFIHGADIDDCKLLVFKCNKHTKGAVDMDILKRGIIYWFERLERWVEN